MRATWTGMDGPSPVRASISRQHSMSRAMCSSILWPVVIAKMPHPADSASQMDLFLREIRSYYFIGKPFGMVLLLTSNLPTPDQRRRLLLSLEENSRELPGLLQAVGVVGLRQDPAPLVNAMEWLSKSRVATKGFAAAERAITWVEETLEVDSGPKSSVRTVGTR